MRSNRSFVKTLPREEQYIKALEYYKLTQPLLKRGEGKIYFESGKDPDTKETYKFEIDARSEEQKELASEIVEGVFPYLNWIANNLLYGDKLSVPTSHRRVNLTLKGVRNFIKRDELVSEGAMAILRGLHNFTPKYKFSSFVYQLSTLKMVDFAAEYYPGITLIPSNIFWPIRRIISEKEKEPALLSIINRFRTSRDTAELFYHTITGIYIRVDDLEEHIEKSPDDEEYLKDPSLGQEVRLEEQLLLENLISLMKEPFAETMRLTFVDNSLDESGLTYKEIAKRTGAQSGTVMSRLYRARKIARRNYISLVPKEFLPEDL